MKNQKKVILIGMNGLSAWRFTQKYFLLYVDSATFRFCMMSMPENAMHTLKHEVVSVSKSSPLIVNQTAFVKIGANGPSGCRFILK